MKHFFVSTPIYYPNAIPHVGHAYASLIADTIARYKKMDGFEVKFCTWVDENSQKIIEKANEEGKEVHAYLDEMAADHKAMWDAIGIEYTNFMRTTSDEHKKVVQDILQKTYDKGDIYEGVYEGFYCVGCEAFIKETDLTPEGLCPHHLTKPQILKEKNYFFRLSKYEKFLSDFYETHPDFVIPESRFAEVKEFVRGGLEDFSISRETNKFGIPLPFDNSQVTYVWYDALCNYLTACANGHEYFWPADLHIVGKDIIKFHAIYWPAMLHAGGYELPKQVLTTGFFTINGQKISKSLGNAINPVEIMNTHSREAVLLYLLSAFPVGQDGDFDEQQLIFTYNAKLANNFGNLVNRFFVLALKLGETLGEGVCEAALQEAQNKATINYQACMNAYNLRGALEEAFTLSDTLNKYLDTTKPWEISLQTNAAQYKDTLYSLGCGIKTIGNLLRPFFPQKMQILLEGLDYGFDENNSLIAEAQQTPKFNFNQKIDPLFPRIEKKEAQ